MTDWSLHVRILQISDTHISAEHSDFAENGAVIARAIAELKPDLVINTGDLSMNGAISAVDLELAKSWHDKLGVPVLTVPGNHDVGDTFENRSDQVLDTARVAQFRTIAGPDRWTHDIDGWRLIGLNAMLFGTGHPEEEVQFEWLAGAVETDAKIAIFMHKPLFIDQPDEGPRGYWTVVPTAASSPARYHRWPRSAAHREWAFAYRAQARTRRHHAYLEPGVVVRLWRQPGRSRWRASDRLRRLYV